MWLKDDLEQFKQNWRQSPWWVRLWMGVSMFLAVSSLASLSETVANWKGFFLDAIAFYREWLTEPLREFFSFFGLRFSSKFADVFVLLLLYFGASFRAISVLLGKEKYAKRGVFWRSILATFVALSFTAYVGTVSGDAFSAGIWGMLALFLFLELLEIKHSAHSRLVILQIVALVVIVGILGAINSGVSAKM